ncbi:hypothetical protein V8E53_015758, partial [Lactarius tabidus]
MCFPVFPAVKHHMIKFSSQWQQKSLRTSCKPTGDKLKSIQVSARPFPSFAQKFMSSPNWPVLCFRAGEYYASSPSILRSHENRFIPLKDGVVSPDLEKSLLGAEVNRIVDSLTLGWYESIFQWYWASKLVKVVSLMGEQSVGKSFTLNHLVDMSFARSAMCTTGMHSLEHSVQEDTVLVPFNTIKDLRRKFNSMVTWEIM